MKEKIAKVIRVLTTPPIFAALLCTLLYGLLPGSFASGVHYVLALVFLTALPLAVHVCRDLKQKQAEQVPLPFRPVRPEIFPFACEVPK